MSEKLITLGLTEQEAKMVAAALKDWGNAILANDDLEGEGLEERRALDSDARHALWLADELGRTEGGAL